MKANGVLASILATVVALFATLVALLVLLYLSEYPSRWVAAGLVSLVGAGIAVIVYRSVLRMPDNRRARVILVSLVSLLVLLPLGSMYLFGEVTYARFGLTVYGLIPVPLMDINVGPRGTLWFRDKTHWVSVEEVQSSADAGAQIIIIGTGWNNAVRVDPKIGELKGIDIRALPTPDAFNLFNRLKAEGLRVALIAHTTC